LQRREIADRNGQSFSIVSGMLDDCNRQLVEITRAHDFIVGDQSVSPLMFQR
jgi:hypothetical protein